MKYLDGKICAYCDKPTEYTDSSVIYGKSYGMIYICFSCDAYVGTHKTTKKSLGRVANEELRKYKKLAHAAFDPIWMNGHKKRSKAYWWLARKMNLQKDQTHIGYFDIDQCKEVIRICNNRVKP